MGKAEQADYETHKTQMETNMGRQKYIMVHVKIVNLED